MRLVLTPNRASEEYEAQKRLTLATLAAVRPQWRRMSGDWDASWRTTVGPRVTTILAAAQLGTVRMGSRYVPEVLEELGQGVTPVGRVNPAPFVGRAADGRDLSSLLSLSVVRARQAGDLEAGLEWLEMVTETELEDAHRQAIQVATVARPRVGYVRMVNTPCCRDCAVQAGRFFRANTGFLRHPHCRCYHLPTSDPASKYAMYPDASEVTGLTVGERKALEAGGDFSQVLNAKRGRSADKMTTTEGRQRGVRGRGRGSAYQRLTPDGIYRLSSSDEQARDLLRRFGYLT